MKTHAFHLIALGICASALQSQESLPPLPFAPGEELVYKAKVGSLGNLGSGVMSVEGPEIFRGREVYLLRFDYRGKVTLFSIEDRTRSWLDPLTMSSMRYEKREKSPLSSSREEVDLNLETGIWKGFKGDSGVIAAESPLDELSFIYFIRTLPLNDTLTHSFDRHFNTERNPVRIRVVRREQLRVPAGTFDAILVEMRVRDPQRYGGEGVILIHLSDDAARIPLRIESSVKVAGALVLSLQSRTQTAGAPAPARKD